MATIEPPYYPIIYVRGYAGNDAEIENTVADPYMGFNLGSTKFRQEWTGDVRRHYFESPLYRLTKDYSYTDVYSNGRFMPEDLNVSAKSIIIYRYYDEQFHGNLLDSSSDVSEITGERKDIESFAEGLSRLILTVRDRVCGSDKTARREFKVYLVAHSMGGLVCRCFLQNPAVGTKVAKQLVDKVFTYATPHNGIDFRVLGNAPHFFSWNNKNNFNRKRMKAYLALSKGTDSVANLKGTFPAERFFCLVGTNWKDYAVAGGWSKRLTGPMSDGLVRIANATVYDQPPRSTKQQHAPRAFVHRSHSGHFGIVNSEEGYQNLVRFLFGDVRVDGYLEIDEITLPETLEGIREHDKTLRKHNRREIRASYHFEVVVKVRGYDWDLHRRTTEEGSAIFRTYDQMFPEKGKPRSPHLFSTFLSAGLKIKKDEEHPSLGFAIELGVLVPDYEVNGTLWRDEFYKGGYLYRDTIILEATPTDGENDDLPYELQYGFQSRDSNQVTTKAELVEIGGEIAFQIPVKSKSHPGLSGRLILKVKVQAEKTGAESASKEGQTSTGRTTAKKQKMAAKKIGRKPGISATTAAGKKVSEQSQKTILFQAIAKVLTEAKRPMAVSEIRKAIIQQNLLPNIGENFGSQVSKLLGKHEQFKRKKRGVYST